MTNNNASSGNHTPDTIRRHLFPEKKKSPVCSPCLVEFNSVDLMSQWFHDCILAVFLRGCVLIEPGALRSWNMCDMWCGHDSGPCDPTQPTNPTSTQWKRSSRKFDSSKTNDFWDNASNFGSQNVASLCDVLVL